MNKLMVTFASLLVVVFADAMELRKITHMLEEKNGIEVVRINLHFHRDFEISEKEKDDFILHLSNAVQFNKKMIEEKKIDENNGIHRILNNLSQDLELYNNDLVVMLQSANYAPVIKCVFDYDLNSRKQIKSLKSPIEIPLVRVHQLYAENYLGEICSQYKYMRYSCAGPLYGDKQACVHHFDKWSGGGDFSRQGEFLLQQDRVDFMVANAEFLSVDDEDEKKTRIEKYIANILYQEIFAKQAHKK